MNIIIAGAGQVGFRLAKTLSLKHNVIILDKNIDALNRLNEHLDVLTIFGNIVDPDIYTNLLDNDYDIFIAVTDNDEINILSTLIVDSAIKVNKKIIRLRNQYFAKGTIANKLGIDDAVFPFKLAARSVDLLFEYPKINNIKNFSFTDFKLASIFVRNSSIFMVKDICKEDLIVVGLERDKELIMTYDNLEILEDDLIYIFGHKRKIQDVSIKLRNIEEYEPNDIAIFGANLLGIEISKLLIQRKINIKILEKDIDKCKKASNILQDRVTIINSKYIEHTLYDDENLQNADVIISTSSKDEDNIIRSLEAKEYGIKKIIAINNDSEFYDLMHKQQIIAARGPKISAYHSIIEKIGSNKLVSQKNFCGGRGVVFIRKIFNNSLILDKTIKPIKLDNTLVFFIRNNCIIPFNDKIKLQDNDIIIIFSKSKFENKIKKWIFNL